jgi:F-type H+-transporting ATPase subunit beta
LLDVTGAVHDHGPPLPADTPWRQIHRAPPPLASQTGAITVFETGINRCRCDLPLVVAIECAAFR